MELQTVGTEAYNNISDSRASLPEWQPHCTFPNMQEITPADNPYISLPHATEQFGRGS